MITCKEYQEKEKSFWNEIQKAKQQVRDLTEERKKFKRDYEKEALKNSPYSIGQKVTTENGKVMYVAGAFETDGKVYLLFNKQKKDGSMSKLREWNAPLTCIKSL